MYVSKLGSLQTETATKITNTLQQVSFEWEVHAAAGHAFSEVYFFQIHVWLDEFAPIHPQCW